MAQAEGAAQGEHEVADLQISAVANAGGGQVIAAHIEHGDIGVDIGPELRGIQVGAIVKADVNVLDQGVDNDVPVGDHVAVAIQLHHNARAGFLDLLAAAPATADFGAGGFDMHHGGGDQAHEPFEHVALGFEMGHIASECGVLGVEIVA